MQEDPDAIPNKARYCKVDSENTKRSHLCYTYDVLLVSATHPEFVVLLV